MKKGGARAGTALAGVVEKERSPEDWLSVREPSLNGIRIRLLEPGDDLEEITEMLHRAYAPLAAVGLKFTATHQTVEVTRSRFERGMGYVAVDGDRIVGTLTLYRPDGGSGVALYREPGIWHLGQFGVEPALKGRGIGRRLHSEAVARAKRRDEEV